MSGRESGRLVNVTIEPLGDALAADAHTGDSTVTVTDASDFDELEGGTLNIGGVQYVYTAVDNDAGTITLASTLSADADAGDRVDVWDVALGKQAVDMTGYVALPGFQANDDPVPATVRHYLVPLLAEGIREPGTEETVKLEHDGDSYEIIDVTGKEPQIQPGFGGGGPVVEAQAFYSDSYSPRNTAGTGAIQAQFDTLDSSTVDVSGLFEFDISTGCIKFLVDGWYQVSWSFYYYGVTTSEKMTAQLGSIGPAPSIDGSVLCSKDFFGDATNGTPAGGYGTVESAIFFATAGQLCSTELFHVGTSGWNLDCGGLSVVKLSDSAGGGGGGGGVSAFGSFTASGWDGYLMHFTALGYDVGGISTHAVIDATDTQIDLLTVGYYDAQANVVLHGLTPGAVVEATINLFIANPEQCNPGVQTVADSSGLAAFSIGGAPFYNDDPANLLQVGIVVDTGSAPSSIDGAVHVVKL